MFANGRFMFDADGNLWSGQNWMPGSQSGAVNSIGGGVLKMAPNGTPLSPPITGFTGMGIDGVGWGTAVTKDRVWITSFNGKLLVMDFDGKPVATEADLPFKERVSRPDGHRGRGERRRLDRRRLGQSASVLSRRQPQGRQDRQGRGP